MGGNFEREKGGHKNSNTGYYFSNFYSSDQRQIDLRALLAVSSSLSMRVERVRYNIIRYKSGLMCIVLRITSLQAPTLNFIF
jgi:hypothetical protein